MLHKYLVMYSANHGGSSCPERTGCDAMRCGPSRRAREKRAPPLSVPRSPPPARAVGESASLPGTHGADDASARPRRIRRGRQRSARARPALSVAHRAAPDRIGAERIAPAPAPPDVDAQQHLLEIQCIQSTCADTHTASRRKKSPRDACAAAPATGVCAQLQLRRQWHVVS